MNRQKSFKIYSYVLLETMLFSYNHVLCLV
nr:MAG TPA: hypothetical protein [Caudoviricetes sp.]